MAQPPGIARGSQRTGSTLDPHTQGGRHQEVGGVEAEGHGVPLTCAAYGQYDGAQGHACGQCGEGNSRGFVPEDAFATDRALSR